MVAMSSTSLRMAAGVGLARLLPARPRTAGDWLELLLGLGVGGAFALAGLLKLMEPQAFARIIGDFGLVPKAFLPPLALLLPVLEIGGGLGLMLGRRGGLWLVTLLDLLFMAVLAYGLSLGLDIDCGCFGPDEPEARYHGTMRQSLWRDAGFLTALLYLFFRRRARSRRPPVHPHP